MCAVRLQPDSQQPTCRRTLGNLLPAHAASTYMNTQHPASHQPLPRQTCMQQQPGTPGHPPPCRQPPRLHCCLHMSTSTSGAAAAVAAAGALDPLLLPACRGQRPPSTGPAGCRTTRNREWSARCSQAASVHTHSIVLSQHPSSHQPLPCQTCMQEQSGTPGRPPPCPTCLT